jgi:hypothetical protein
MNQAKMRLIDRIADRVDLAIDLLTLGQYGLEAAECPAHVRERAAAVRDVACEGGKPARCEPARRETRAATRHRGCARPAARTAGS